MRKILTLRSESGSKKNKKFKKSLVPIAVTALFLLVFVFCVAAAEMIEDQSPIEAALPETEIPSSKRPERATVTVIKGGYEYAKCNSPIMSVSELLSHLDIVIDENTVLDCDSDDEIFDGMTVKIGSYTTEYYTEDIEIPYETVYISSQTIPRGKTELAEEGRNGLNVLTHEIVSVDGVVISDTVISEGVSYEPVNAVYYKGSGGTVTAEDGTVYNYSYYIDVIATAYHTGGITATGHVANEEVVAVDPKVIPYGTKMFITGKWGEVGYRSAEDCGNFRGKRIDVCMEGTRAELLQFGKRNMRVYILE